MPEQKTKLASNLPEPPKLTERDLVELDKESTALVAAVETHTASLEKLDDSDLRIRLR